MKNVKTYLIYTAFGIGGILIGAMLFGGASEPQTMDEHIAESHTNEHGEIIYTCSMHPQIRENEPGDCPICGMELIPVDNATSSADPNELVMTQAAIKLAEIETTPVIKAKAVATLRLPGKVMINPNKSSAITSHIAGRISELYVDFKGDYVKAGEPVASIYSPDLITAQQELLETARYKDQNPVLYKAARKKLELWELPESTIDEIEAGNKVMEHVDIVSPVSGFVQKISVQRQQHVMDGSMMFEVTDLSSVWVMFDAYESNLALLKNGQKVDFTTNSYPGQTFSGTVNYIDPMVQNSTRSVKVRVEVQNPKNLLKPNMLVQGIVKADINQAPQLLIPKSAVMWTGTRSIVFVQKPATAEPTFAAREVVLGDQVGDRFIVMEGLDEGEKVVTNGTFKLDSAAQLADKLSMMNRTPGVGANRTGHEGHAMPEMKMESAEHTSHEETSSSAIPGPFKKQLSQVVTDYLNLKDALVSSEAGATSNHAKEVLGSLSNVDMSLVKGDLHMQWMQYLNELHAQSEIIQNQQDLKTQRQAFIALSEALIQTVKTFELPGVIYKQHCPMANGSAGADWLSTEAKIANPYFGDKMLRCGETIEKIEFK